MRLQRNPVIRNHADDFRHLKGRDRDETLSDRDGNRFTRVPWFPSRPLFPFRGRDQARFFAREVNARSRSQPELFRISRNGVHTHAIT